MLIRQADIKARLRGYYDPVDEPTRLHFNGVVRCLGAMPAKGIC
jgi:hypothetical protein